MKRIIILLLLATSVIFANEQELIAELSSLNIVQESQINLLKVKDEGDLYMIKAEPMWVPPGQQKKSITFYLTKDKKVLLTGNAIYTNTKERVLFPLDKSILQGKEAFSYGTGPKVLYAFTDPQCPYCKKFEQKMAKLGDKYTFKIYLYPLPMHPEAIPMSKWVLAGKDSKVIGERLIALANDSTEYKNLVLTPQLDQKLTQDINAQIAVAQDAEINSTPTILDSNMNKINWSEL